MIRNCDGTPFELGGCIQLFDPESPEHALFNQWDAEQIRMFGSPIFYYEVLIQIQNVDQVYNEDRGKIFSNNPIQLFCSYEPITPPTYMGLFGADGLLTQSLKFDFNYQEVLKLVGHPLVVGSRLFTPHKRENWIIAERQVGEFKNWGELRFSVLAEKFQESWTTGEGRVAQKQPSFKLNESQLLNKKTCDFPSDC